MSKKQILRDADKLQIQLESEGFQNLSDVLLENLNGSKFSKDMLDLLEEESERENRELWNSMQMQRKFNEDLESKL